MDFTYTCTAFTRRWQTCRGSMQSISRDQTKEKIFVVVGNSGCRGPAPIFARWLVRAQAPRVGPFSRTTEDKPNSTGVRRCRCCAMARRICSGIPGPRGHRRWSRFGRCATLDNHISGFTSSKCCNLFGNWIDTLVFWRGIFRFLPKALARLGLSSQPPRIPCLNVCHLLVVALPEKSNSNGRFPRLPGSESRPHPARDCFDVNCLV